MYVPKTQNIDLIDFFINFKEKHQNATRVKNKIVVKLTTLICEFDQHLHLDF